MFRRRGQNGTPSTRLSLGADPHRGWMARQLETLAGIGDLPAVNLEDRNVLVEIIADQQILSVGREHRPFRQPADLDVAKLGDLLAFDAQHRDATIAFVKIGILIIGAGQDNGDRNIAVGRDGKPLRLRGGVTSRSTTLTVSTLPSEEPAPPLSAVNAIFPL